MSRSLLGVLACALVLGCASQPAPQAPVAPLDDPNAHPSTARPTSINLDHADSYEVIVIAQMLLEEPVLVEASALAPLRCASVTIKEANPLPPRDGAKKVLDALRSQGFRAVHSSSGWTVGIDEVHPPQACSPEGRATAAGEARPSPTTTPGAADTQALVDEVVRSIREISPTEHAVPRHSLDVFLEHQDMMMKSARIVPEVDASQKPVGIRIFGIRPDSILGRLGFENGDRVDRINGKPVDTPEHALDAYAAMRGAKKVEIEIQRRGGPKKLVVDIE